MEPSDSKLTLRDQFSDSQIIEAAVNLEMGQTRYQNDTFVVGSQITPYKKVQQALLELETRQHGYTELKYKHRLCINNRKKIKRALDQELSMDIKDDIEIERLEIELEKALFDESIYERKYKTYEREISEFCDMVREHMDPKKDIEYYRVSNDEEDRKYWITRMAKQAAVDVHNIGRVGSGNLDSILNMPPEDQLLALKAAVEHATLLTAGVEKMQKQLMPEVRKILESVDEQFTVPTLMESKKESTTNALPEVKNNVPREKFRIQSSDKSKT